MAWMAPWYKTVDAQWNLSIIFSPALWHSIILVFVFIATRIRAQLYYDGGPLDMARFSSASFNNSYWRATYILMADQLCYVSN